MAWDIGSKKTVMGNLRVVLADVITDSASSQIETGLSNIESIALAPMSMTTSAIKISTTDGSGTITVSNCVSGDEFFLTVFGV